jgi:hypothetical protein
MRGSDHGVRREVPRDRRQGRTSRWQLPESGYSPVTHRLTAETATHLGGLWLHRRLDLSWPR